MSPLIFAAVILAVYMSGLFVIATVVRNNGVADIGYGIAAVVVIVAAAVRMESVSAYVLVLCALPLIWGVRLAVRIYLKNRGKPEDFRYKAWRDSWGRSFMVRSFFQIYMLQGSVVYVVALPVLLAIVYPSNVVYSLYILGVAVWLVGFFFESVGDFQLDTFIRNPLNKGAILMSGLWRYSRHPNYFGESMMWWGVAIASSGLTTVPVLGIVSPVLITYLLLKVSGVPLLEKRWEGNPAWEDYKRRTSVFFPLPPKR